MLASDRGKDPTLGLAWRFARFGMQEQLRIVRRRLGLLRLLDLTEDALHSSVGIASSREPEISMVHYGAGLDLFGARLGEIPRLDLERLLEEWPRCGFKTEFPACLERQVERKPGSHIAGAMGLGLAGRVRAAPFAE